MPYILYTTETNYNSGGTRVYFFTCKEKSELISTVFEIYGENEILPTCKCNCTKFVMLNSYEDDYDYNYDYIKRKYDLIESGKKIKFIHFDKLENTEYCKTCKMHVEHTPFNKIYDMNDDYIYFVIERGNDKIIVNIKEVDNLENISWLKVNA